VINPYLSYARGKGRILKPRFQGAPGTPECLTDSDRELGLRDQVAAIKSQRSSQRCEIKFERAFARDRSETGETLVAPDRGGAAKRQLSGKRGGTNQLIEDAETRRRGLDHSSNSAGGRRTAVG